MMRSLADMKSESLFHTQVCCCYYYYFCFCILCFLVNHRSFVRSFAVQVVIWKIKVVKLKKLWVWSILCFIFCFSFRLSIITATDLLNYDLSSMIAVSNGILDECVGWSWHTDKHTYRYIGIYGCARYLSGLMVFYFATAFSVSGKD